METVFGIVLLLFVLFLKYAVRAENERVRHAEKEDAAQAEAAHETGGAKARKTAQTRRVEQWYEERRRRPDAEQEQAVGECQADAEQTRFVSTDGRESKLESLKTLYEAGILDREEYAERVARVAVKHGRGTEEA